MQVLFLPLLPTLLSFQIQVLINLLLQILQQERVFPPHCPTAPKGAPPTGSAGKSADTDKYFETVTAKNKRNRNDDPANEKYSGTISRGTDSIAAK